MTATIHATCEVQGYWGEYVGYYADLIAFRTKRHGETMTRYRWRSENGSCRDIPGTFPTIKRALEAARRCKWARGTEVQFSVDA